MNVFWQVLFFIPLYCIVFLQCAFAEFQQKLVDEALRMSVPGLSINQQEVTKSVQAINILSHQLELEADPVRAANIADTILQMIGTGKGVNGLRPSTAAHARMNSAEMNIAVQALTKATELLQKKKVLDDQKLSQLLSDIIRTNQKEKDAHSQHTAYATSIIFGAYKKQQGESNVKAVHAAFLSSFNSSEFLWLHEVMADETVWNVMAPYIEEPIASTFFNSEEREWLNNHRKLEAPDYDENLAGWVGVYEEEVKTLLRGDKIEGWDQYLGEFSTIIQETTIPEKAYAYALNLKENIKGEISQLLNLSLRDEVIKALVVVEKFRLFEVRDKGMGDLKNKDPDIADYVHEKPDAKSQAILLAIVSAIQNSIYNPAATVEDLIELFKYQKNNSAVPQATHAEAKRMIESGEIARFINPALIQLIHDTKLNINREQKLYLDRLAEKQKLIFMPMPLFDLQTGKWEYSPTFFRFIKSYGDGQCGYYSLRCADGRGEYVTRITDNLQEDEINGPVLDSLLQYGDEKYIDLLKDALFAFRSHQLEGIKQTEVSEQALQETAKVLSVLNIDAIFLLKALQSLGIFDEELETAKKIIKSNERLAVVLSHLTEGSEGGLITAILQMQNQKENTAQLISWLEGFKESLSSTEEQADIEKIAIMQQILKNELDYESQLVAEGLTEDLSDEQHDLIARKQKLYMDKNAKKEKLLKELSRYYPLEPAELRMRVQKAIKTIDSGGWLDVGSKADWKDQILTFPHVHALLTNQDIYAWMPLHSKRHHQSVYENGSYFLANYVSASSYKSYSPSHPVRAHLYNETGEWHYDKWVEDNNYADLAHAFRHKQKHDLGDTISVLAPLLPKPAEGKSGFSRFSLGSIFNKSKTPPAATTDLVPGEDSIKIGPDHLTVD